MSLRTVGSLLFVLLAACGGQVTEPDPAPNPPVANPSVNTGTNTGTGPATNIGTGTTGTTTGTGLTGTQQGPTTPTTASATWANASGCGNMSLHVIDATGRRFLNINVSRQDLGLNAKDDKAVIDFDHPDENASKVTIAVFGRDGGGRSFCTDVGDPDRPDPEGAWQIVSGSIGVILEDYKDEYSFTVALSIGPLVLKSAAGDTINVPFELFHTIQVGWLPG